VTTTGRGRQRRRRPTVALLSALVVGVLATVLAGGAAERAWITVLSTTDLHGNLLPIDYYTNREDQRGLAKIATLIKQARAENPSGTVLVDSGDVIQGSPLQYVHNTRNNAPPDAMMRAMSALGYDAMAVGNHEYNFGLTVLEKARREASFPWLSANTYRTGTDDTYHRPYVVKELAGVRVGILGLTTAGVPFWENTENYPGLEFRRPLDAARRWVGVLRSTERVDLVVVAMHMGLEEDLRTGVPTPGQVRFENEALAIAREVPGVNLIVMGHTHRDVPGVSVNGVLIMQANLWGRHLARADVYLERGDDARWRVVGSQSRTLPVTEATAVDPEIAAIAAPYDQEARAWLSRPIGVSAAELTAEQSRVADTALIDLVQRVQLDYGKADVSMAAVFNRQARIPQGQVSVRDIAGLYIYDNTLVVLEMTGGALKAALEHSARFFKAYVPGRRPEELVDERIPDYNFDQAEGVTYDLDITRPVGQRVRNLRFKGAPLADTQMLRVATNNYRVSGGGGYSMYADAKVILRSSQEIREMIIDWVEKGGTIPSKPTDNWRIVTAPN
jgi:2',3'-cyclic-nucleotide 2'-phosphodiesterase / 3'-nucleotidase